MIVALVVWLGHAGLSAAEAAKTDVIAFEFALYFTPKPSANPAVELARLLRDRTLRLRIRDASEVGDALATVEAKWSPLTDYAPPSADSLRYTGVGVTPDEAPKLAEADRVFIVGFSTSRQGALVTNRSACVLLADLAEATGGKIWDEETRQMFSLARWRSDRIDTWQGGLPDMSKQVTMHAYANPDLIRIITLGQRKFGLPDLVVAELPRQHFGTVGNFINAFMQRMVEGQKPQDAKMRLTLADIRHAAARSRALENPAKGAKGMVLVSTQPTPLEDGDPRNTLWRLDFPETKAKETVERALWGMAELFGSTDSIIGAASGDADMAAARMRARQAFFAQEARFRAGLSVGEHLMVKGPFSQAGETEYMWVEVVKWGPKHVEGLLTSDPYYVKKLRAGSKVSVPFDDIFDYILYKVDGTQEGNESGKVLERLQKNK